MPCKKRKTKRKKVTDIGGRKEDARNRRKFKKGGRIEAYTMGEALGKKGSKWV